MKFIELFAGIGGFRYGLEQVVKNVNTKDELHDRQQLLEGNNNRAVLQEKKKATYTCVYANEFNKYAAGIYERNFNEQYKKSGEREHRAKCTHCIDTRDIREVKASEIPDHELLTAGFPCQSFSIAGKRGGFEDTRGTLFFEIARILQQKQPRLLLLENVKGLLSHDKGKTFGTILNTLDELGYDLQWQVLNSKDFGVPQNRERVFIIGHLRGTSRPEVFPIGESNGASPKELTQGMNQADGVYDVGGSSPTVPTSGGGRHEPKVAIPVLTPDRLEKRQNGRRFKEDGEPAFTLTGQDKHGVSDGIKIRRLTPLECERLQGFPDGWTEGVSDTQRYKCLGNAVTTNVITAIGNKLLKDKQ